MFALEGITILDLSGGYPPSFATGMLGDMGADVINIEGRMTREKPSKEEEILNAAYQANNRNKKSIILNLKTKEAQKIFYKLAENADVIVDPFRPGVTKRLGVDYDTIKKINPRIIYCALSGYGQDGPYRDIPGHDLNYISVAGILDMIGEPDKKPAIPLNMIADFGGAVMHGTIGILIALIARYKTGKGQFVDISYTDTSLPLLDSILPLYFRMKTAPKRGTIVPGGGYPFCSVYKAKDGRYVTISLTEPWMWERFCRELGREDFIPYHNKPEYWIYPPQGEKWEEIRSSVEEFFMTKTSDEWFEYLSKKDICVAKVKTIDEAFNDPQLKHRQMLLELDHPTLGKVKQLGIAIKLSDTPGKVRSLAPLPGENTEEILLKLGYSKEKIAELRHGGAII
jgi:crotonobetainyl-CoA:carnitine CoA-transferase CaiB-like acyl-CoA transferase